MFMLFVFLKVLDVILAAALISLAIYNIVIGKNWTTVWLIVPGIKLFLYSINFGTKVP